MLKKHKSFSPRPTKNFAYHVAWANFISEQDYTHVLTLQWNRSIGFDKANEDLKELHAHIDRKLLGPRYTKKPERSQAIFFLEGEPGLNLHAHSAWWVKPQHQLTFESLFPKDPSSDAGAWKTIAPAGTQVLKASDNVRAEAAYLTKEIHWDGDDRRLIFSHEFFPSPSPQILQA